MTDLTLGSLFDGSGGFPLAGIINGITPLWASEIEPFPIRVTTKRLPQMKHYGDISKLNGAELPPVDIVTFGSPCTNLSIAGRREGLGGEQSSLFFQAIRIIKEMRAATNGKKPRFIVWENVPGAYSSSGGDDFLCVLEKILKVKEDTLSVPLPPKRKWLSAGEIVGDNFSVAYKAIDAQHFGVPQRRRRVYLVADFDGERAGDVLFEYESVSWHFAESGVERQGTADGIESGVGTAKQYAAGVGGISQRVQVNPRVAVTISATGGGCGGRTGLYLLPDKKNVAKPQKSISCYEQQAYDKFVENDKGACLKAQGGTYGGGSETLVNDYKVRRLTPLECCRLQGFPDYWCADLETQKPTDADMAFWTGVFEEHRRITETSVKTRTQIIKWLKNPHSDAAEYKMWGNGIALPCAVFILAGLVKLSNGNGGENE